MEPSAWGFWIALGVMLIGLVGAVLPGIPGVLLIWLAALIYAIGTGFQSIGPIVLVILTVLAVIGATADLWVSSTLGRVGGASWHALAASIVLGFLGLLVGLLFAGVGAVPGAIVGSVSGILIVEYRRRKNLKGAARASAGWL